MTVTIDQDPATRLMCALLEGFVKFLDRATMPSAPPAPFLGDAMAAAYAGAAARLLRALMDGQPAGEVAAQLHEWMSDGEPLAEWAAEQAAVYGVDIDHTIQPARESE